MEERIQKILSQQGVCSRRAAEQMIREGRVKLNGHPAGLGDRMDSKKDVLVIDGNRIHMERRVEKLYYMLNKPRGYVTTLGDRHAKQDVGELMEGVGVRLFPVGRLDKDSEGLLLMTNDGDFANQITHPSHGVRKSYRVSVKPSANEEQLAQLAGGVRLEEGVTAPTSVRVTSDEPDRTVFEIALEEGRNREIRRMCESVGLTVTRLKRTAVGPLRLGSLKSGEYRELQKQEVIALRGASKKPRAK